MATATDVVYGALSYILERQAEAGIEDDELQDGIDTLNDMMTSLEEQNVYLGYTYITDGAQQVTVSPGVLLGIKQNLAIQIAPMFGGSNVSAQLARNAANSMTTIMNSGLQRPDFAYPSTLPRGMGRRWYNQTNNVFFNGLTVPEANIYFEANTTDTVIATVETPVVIAGTWVETTAREFTTTAAGLITYTASTNKQFNISSRFTTTVTAKHVNIYAYLNGVKLTQSKASAYVATTAMIPLYCPVLMKKDDTLQFYIENIDDATDVLISNALVEVK
jgi:hypothetical protein